MLIKNTFLSTIAYHINSKGSDSGALLLVTIVSNLLFIFYIVKPR